LKTNRFIGDREFYNRVKLIGTPILIQNIITNFVSLLDNLMVGQIGSEQMSGVAIVNQFFFVFMLCIFGGLAGAGIFTAQFYGKDDVKGERDTFRMKLYIAAISCIAFAAIFLTIGDSLISSFLHKGEEGLDLEATLKYGRQYMAIMLFELVPFALTQVYASTLRETGETVLPMKAGVIALLVNLFFNYLLIFGKFGFPELGVIGAAIATVLSRFVECAIVMIGTHSHTDRHKFIIGAYESLKLPPELAKRIIITGSPLLINELLWSAGMTVLNQCYSVRGLEIVPATNIAMTIFNLFFCAFLAMGSTISILIGQRLGAGELEKAVEEDTQLLALSLAMSIAIGLVMGILAPLIPQLYNTTPLIKSLASKMLIVSAFIMPANGFTNACYFTLRSGGKTVITFIFDSGFLWIICIPLAFIISRFTAMPIMPMYILLQGMDFIKAIIGFVFVKRKKWVTNLVSE